MITDHPLGLPQGSVRAIIALMLSIAMVVIILRDSSGIQIEAIKSVALLVIGQYFGARPDRKE